MNKRYTSVTANLNTDGSLSIIAWKGPKEFDTIPLSDGKGGEIKRVQPVTPLTEAAQELLAALREVEADYAYNRCHEKRLETRAQARAAITKAAHPSRH